MVIINPGSRLPEDPQGWTNTYEQAVLEARGWLAGMRGSGFGHDIDLIEPGVEVGRRWIFHYRHRVTGVGATLETHGIDDQEAYRRQATFSPRVYWNGSSCSIPGLEDFAAPGYIMTFQALQKDGE